MSEVKSVPGILDVIKSITSNGESGRLEISSAGAQGSGTRGVLLFTEGKLVDARLESLSGFQAVNAAVALRDVEFSFDHVVPAPHAVSITPSERVVLKRFFGIEAAEMEEAVEFAEPDPGWNETPEQVVPLSEVEESVPLFTARRFGNARRFVFLLRPQVAVGLVLVLGLVVGAIATRSRIKARQQSETSVAGVVASGSTTVASDSRSNASESGSVSSASSSVTSESTRVSSESSSVTSESSSVASKSSAVPDAPAKVEPVPSESPEVPVSQRSSATASPRQTAPVKSGAVSQPLSAEQRDKSGERDVDVHDLNGEWRLINVVEKTDYKSFHNMQLGFRLKINQKGKEFTATGEKFSENGQMLPANSRTPIQLTGSIEGDTVVATFVEDGRRRRTNGRFVWKLQGGDKLTGTFVSTAATTVGRSAVRKSRRRP